jgi:hypothetical protein
MLLCLKLARRMPAACALVIAIAGVFLQAQSVHAAPAPAVAAGVSWLTQQARSDGSYSTSVDVGTAFQSTAEAVRTLRALGHGSELSPAITFLSAELYDGTEYLARKIIATAEAGGDVSNLVTELVARQGVDGGFGEFSGYDSTALDTGFALEALDSAGFADSTVIANALSYLTSHQNADGGFVAADPTASSVYSTAVIAHALQRFQLKFSLGVPIDSAARFLYGQQLAGGGWASTWETALALLATVPVTTDPHLYTNAVQVLTAGQGAAGDWDGSVYNTALAVRALNIQQNASPPVNPTTGALSGRTSDQQSGQPLAGVQVTLSGATTANSVSDANGQFQLAGVAPGQFTLRFDLTGYSSVSQTVTVTTGQVVDIGVVQLTPLPTTTVISGTVTDGVTALPIAGAIVHVTGTGDVSVTTGADGHFQLAVSPGLITLDVSAPGYGDATGTVTSRAGDQLRFSPALTASGTPPNTQTTVAGTVVDDQSGTAIAGATIQLENTTYSATSAADGSFSLAGIVADGYTALVTATGYNSVQMTFAAAAGTQTSLGTLRLTRVAAITSVTLSGAVQDASTGAPIAGARVTVASISSLTGADGRYLLSGITDLQFMVGASANGYVGSTNSFQVAQFGNYATNIPLQPVVSPGVSISQFFPQQPSYPAYAKASLTAQFANNSDQPASLQLVLQIQDASGREIGRIPAVHAALPDAPADSLLAMQANATLSTDFNWSTLDLPPGRYQLTLDAYDLNTLQLLTQRSTAVEVIATQSIPSLVVEPAPLYGNVGASAQIQLTAVIANRSNVPVDLAFTFALKDPNGTAVHSGSSSLTLAPQNAQTSLVVDDFPLLFALAGQYTIDLQVTSAVTPGVISGQKISVAPAIRIDPTESISPTTVVPDGDKRVHVQIQLKGVNP